jgi:hypothetical protein
MTLPPDDSPHDTRHFGVEDSSSGARLSALEREIAELRGEVASLRSLIGPAAHARTATSPQARAPHLSPALASTLRAAPNTADSTKGRPSLADRVHAGAVISGDDLESLVGRYATLALAALVILMAVGAVIKMAVQRGLLTPEVRVGAGVLAATALAIGGIVFRRRREVRYGNVLLALSLAVVDLVAWGAGPRLHLVPTPSALAIVDVVAVALGALALNDGSEFLFSVAFAGALSAPFVTSDGGGTALALLLYGGAVIAGALRTARDPAWSRTFWLLAVGALVYAAAASALAVSSAWYGPYLIALFGGGCATAALVFGEQEWRGDLPRAYLVVSLVGVISGWEAVGAHPVELTFGVAIALALVTYAALLVRHEPSRHWTPSAVLLPFISLGVAFAGAIGSRVQGMVFALWMLFSLAAWRLECSGGDRRRGGAHLLAAVLLGSFAVTVWLWATPLGLVAGLAGWGVAVALLSRSEESPLPLAGIALVLGAAAVSAIDQLASRSAYSYTPFATRSSASAACVAVGIAVVGTLLVGGSGVARTVADRPLRLGALIGFLIVWGRMELANAFNADLASFLLTSYYAGCGVASIVVGRRFTIPRLRVAGLGLAMYAAFKAVVEVTNIGSVALRVAAYGAVGVFLLGAGYLYRDRRADMSATME